MSLCSQSHIAGRHLLSFVEPYEFAAKFDAINVVLRTIVVGRYAGWCSCPAQKGNKPQTPANTACGNQEASLFCVAEAGAMLYTIGQRAIDGAVDGAVGMHALC